MSTSDKSTPGRGRPRKLSPGETVEWRLRAPESLLMELRIHARMNERSVNEEITARLMQSLNYQPDKPPVSSVEAERLLYLAVKFEEWVSSTIKIQGESITGQIIEPEETLWVWRDSGKKEITGKISGHNIRIPESLASELRVMARVHERGQNEEVLTRLLDSFGYYSQRLLEQNDDAQALKILCLEFEQYLKVKIKDTEKTLKK